MIWFGMILKIGNQTVAALVEGLAWRFMTLLISSLVAQPAKRLMSQIDRQVYLVSSRNIQICIFSLRMPDF